MVLVEIIRLTHPSYLLYFKGTPRTLGDNRSGSSSTGSSPKGSLPTTPCSSPQAVSSTPGSQGMSSVKYFVVKPSDQKTLDVALSKSVYATSPKSETKFNKAIQVHVISSLFAFDVHSLVLYLLSYIVTFEL